MATKTANLNMRIEPNKKEEAEKLFDTLGMTLPQAVNMFISQSLLVGGLPFDVKVPKYNRETVLAMNEAEDIDSGKIRVREYDSVDDLLNDLERK